MIKVREIKRACFLFYFFSLTLRCYLKCCIEKLLEMRLGLSMRESWWIGDISADIGWEMAYFAIFLIFKS